MVPMFLTPDAIDQIDPDEVYSSLEAAQLIGVPRRTLGRLVERRQVRRYLTTPNGHHFYLGSELRRFMKLVIVDKAWTDR